MSKKIREKSAPARPATKSVAGSRRSASEPKPKASGSAAAKAPSRQSRRGASAAKEAAERSTGSDIVREGQPAPPFDLPRDGGGRVALRDFAGRKLVLFFYPRANTPGCTKEAMDFSRLASEFAASGTDVIGLSADTVKAQDSFRNKYNLTIPLASDEHKDILKAYGAWGEKMLYGKAFLGILRTTVLIDPRGRIARVWRNVRVDGHAEAVLASSRTL
jgi:peroxiredoxin Q/BCP